MKKGKKTPAENDGLIFLLIIAFVFIASCGLLMAKKKITPRVIQIVLENFDKKAESKTYPPLPKLKDGTTSFPVVSAQAALALDLDSRIALYEKNPDARFLPASTTKIVSALVALEYYPDAAVLKVDGLRVPGQDMNLVRGEEITARALLEGLLIYSANDAAEVLAENYCVNSDSCGRQFFIEAMNNKARELHLANTRFQNPTGFDNSGHYSTARDLITVAEIAMRNPRFAEIVGIKEKTVTSVDGRIKHKLLSTNKLLGSVVGVVGVKTGWTEEARENLVTYLENDGHKIMIALLGSQDRFGETKEIIDWINENYEWEKVKYPLD